MTVAQLIEKLKEMPMDAPVFITYTECDEDGEEYTIEEEPQSLYQYFWKGVVIMAKKMRVLRDGNGNPIKVVSIEDKALRCGMVFTTDYGLRMTIANYDDTSGLWLCEIPGQNYTRYFDEYTIKKYLGWRK